MRPIWILPLVLIHVSTFPTLLAYSVCLTGAGGFLGSEVLVQLLSSDEVTRISATCRKANPWLIETAKIGTPKLEVHENLDLLAGAFDRSMQGCDVVIHTASPFPSKIRDQQHAQEVVDAAVRSGVKRVVVTSSMAAIRGPRDTPQRDWNGSSRRDGEGMEPYQWAKTAAEKVAFEVGDAGGVEVLSVLPTWIAGPPRHPHVHSASVELVRGWLRGRGKVQSRLVCDVRDAAAAHVIAATAAIPSGSTRRVLVGGESRVTAGEMRLMLAAGGSARADADFAPDSLSPADTWVPPVRAGSREVDVQASLGLLGVGFSLRPPRETLADMVTALTAQQP